MNPPPNFRRRQSRSGFSLVELLVIITLMSGMTLVAGKILTLFFELDAAVATDAALLLNRERLEDRFRNDIHESFDAIATRNAEGEQTLDLKTSNGTVRYVVSNDTMTREARVSESQMSRDRYVLPGYVIDISIQTPLIQLIISPQKDINDMPLHGQILTTSLNRQHHLTAYLNRNRHLQSSLDRGTAP